MRIAVVTPYYQEDAEVLRACHDSVCSQTHQATHILVADGYPQDWIRGIDAQHIVLPISHRDSGNTPRAIGSLSAISQEFDGIAYLDADNWYQETHVETVVRLRRESKAAICSTRRSMHRLDGSLMGYCFASDGEDFVDTNCLTVFEEGFSVLPQWTLMPKWAHPIGDRMMWHLLRESGLKRAHSTDFTVSFRDGYDAHYIHLGEKPPKQAKSTSGILRAIATWRSEGLPSFKTDFQIRKTPY